MRHSCTICGEPIDFSKPDSWQKDWSAEDTMGCFYFHESCLDYGTSPREEEMFWDWDAEMCIDWRDWE